MKNTKLIIVILTIFAVLTTVLFIENKYNNTTNAENNDFEYVQLKFPENDLDISDWETYRNEELGFEVKYPENWEVLERTKNEFSDNPGFVFLPKERQKIDDRGTYLFIQKKQEVSLENDNNKFINNNIVGLIVDYKLGVWDESRKKLDNRDVLQKYLYKGDIFYYSIYNPSSDNKELQEVFEQIVLSFKFI